MASAVRALAHAPSLGGDPDPRSMDALAELIKEGNSDSVELAIGALGDIGGDGAVQVLLDALSKNEGVNDEAIIEALGRTKSPLAYEKLISMLRPPPGGDVVEDRALARRLRDAREEAAKALGKLGDARAVDPLLDLAREETGYLRADAIEALCRIEDVRALIGLIEARSQQDFSSYYSMHIARVIDRTSDPAVFDAMLVLLTDRDFFMRKAATHALGRIKDPRAEEPLAQRIGHEDDLTAYAAAIALYGMNPELTVRKLAEVAPRHPELAKELLMAIQTPEAVLALLTALEALEAKLTAGRMGDLLPRDPIENPAAIAALVAAVGDDSRSVNHRRMTLRLLAQAKAPKAVDAILPLLRHEEARIRADAARALGQLADPRAVEPLVAALNDDQPEVQVAAIHALGDLGDNRATRHLMAMHEARYSPFPRSDLSGPLTHALSQLGDDRPVDELLAFLANSKSYALPQARVVRGLGASGDPRAIEPLVRILRDNRFLADPMIEALTELKIPEVVDAMAAMADEDNSRLQEAALRILAGNEDPRVADILAKLLQNETLCLRAATALTRLNDPRGQEALLAMLRDHPHDKHELMAVLFRLKPPSRFQAVRDCADSVDPEEFRRMSLACDYQGPFEPLFQTACHWQTGEMLVNAMLSWGWVPRN
ncbi:MAG: HEAT repeat domain-containing protein, partial [Planctomycetes bacterium]|nr:HEAT repeat domain-containing protein [Planctomycetota bacterium]